ncbi:hypothetical protein [Spirosoma areae]
MTLFNVNPYECNDIDTLREWVVLLREMTINLKGMGDSGLKVQDMLYQVNVAQGEQIALLKARITQYQVAFSAQSCNDVRRLN